MSFLQQSVELESPRWQALQPWVAALLSDAQKLPRTALPLESATREGVLPWLAHSLHDAGRLQGLGDQQPEIRKVLNHCAAVHLFGERELSRLAALSRDFDMGFVVFKGHAVARTLYAHPACRPTSDFDLLVAPGQVAAAQDWLKAAGYRPYDPYYGTLWLASQVWVPETAASLAGSLDLHWDVSSRMYFRHRVSIDALIRDAPRVPCGETEIRVPCPIDNLVIACIHLAAMDPGITVDLRWLLDIRLLMAEIAPLKIDNLVERAREWHAAEACLVFGEAAGRLDDSPVVQPVLEALRAAASPRRMAEYDRTLRSRGYDLWRYWLRLGAREKVGLVGDAVRKVFRR